MDKYEIGVEIDHPTILAATLSNNATYPIYLTGVQVVLSDGASGDIYNPVLLQESLRLLDPGQRWDGPLVVIKAKHRGPLLVKGSIKLNGGNSQNSGDPLVSGPIHLTIDDPKRQWDGSYVREALPACDRISDACCDLDEAQCFKVANRCVYVAEGYDRQKICVDQEPGKVYEHISDLRVSSDSMHVAYLASFGCQSSDREEHCKKTVVFDHIELPAKDIPTHLSLSPDGSHYAYIGRTVCIFRMGEESCSGASHPVVDGKPVARLPGWYSGAP